MVKGLSGKSEEWIGKTVEVLSMDNKLNFMGKISSFENGVMCIEDAAGRDTPPVIYGQEIKLRVQKSGTASLIVYGYICGSSQNFWRLDRLESCNISEKREHFRHSIYATASVVRINGGQPGQSRKQESVRCQVLDVSAGGVLIRCREDFEVGDVLSMSGLVIVPEMEPFSFACCIRRRTPNEEEKDFLYGCQFQGLSAKDEDRIMKAILMAQREKLRQERAMK